MLKALLALIAAALFAGAALYVNIAEHPARMRLDDRSALAQWKPSYARATWMQASLALVSAALGLWAWWNLDIGSLLVGALLIGAAIPFTLIIIFPINRGLEATTPDAAGPESRALLTHWGRFHAVRTLLAFAAVAAYLAAFDEP